jgi:hypothetical protein
MRVEMKIVKLFLLLAMAGVGFCYKMTDKEICNLLYDTAPVNCEHGHNELAIIWKDRYSILTKNSENKVHLKCGNKVALDFHNFPRIDLSHVQELKIDSCSAEDENILTRLMYFFNFSGVINLSFEVGTNDSITPAMLHAFSHVKTLELIAPYKNQFEENAFVGFEVKNLKITAYDYQKIPRNLLASLADLRNLEITLDATGKKDEPRDWDLAVNRNRNLDSFSLRGMRWPMQMEFPFGSVLTTVEFTNNNMVELSEKFCGQATTIINLTISACKLKRIPDNFLSRQTLLSILNLSHNEITAINSVVFSKSPDLTAIDLSHNKIDILEK